MKATLSLEFIGADSADWLNAMTRQFNQFAPGLGDRMIGRATGSPWVAEILGRHDHFKLERQFLRSNRDYSRANSKGSRGVYLWYILESDHLYEVLARTSWKNSQRYFCTVTDDGCIYVLTDDEVHSRMAKRALGIDVLTAARERIAKVFDDFPRIYLSFSGGKDSAVMMHLVMAEAIERKRKIGVLFVDLEAQYKLTIDHVSAMYNLYAEHILPYWVALPIHLRNAVSQYEPQWVCWQPSREADWVRQPHPMSITDENTFPFFRRAMEFEEFVPAFGKWFAKDKLCACFVGIRSDESLNRYRTIAGRKSTFDGRQWMTWCGDTLYNAYPIYDWRTQDIWTFNGKFKAIYNRLYDRMHQAGLTIHQARICQPYGDDQRKGLWLFHIIEPETWARVVARVNGANQGSLYCQDSGNILGCRGITKPSDITWREFADRLLASMPERTAEQYRNKIAVFLKWYEDRGYSRGIPDEGKMTDKSTPSWTRIVKALLRNDYWCKGLSFSQNKTTAFEKYQKLMKRRRQEWRLI